MSDGVYMAEKFASQRTCTIHESSEKKQGKCAREKDGGAEEDDRKLFRGIREAFCLLKPSPLSRKDP